MRRLRVFLLSLAAVVVFGAGTVLADTTPTQTVNTPWGVETQQVQPTQQTQSQVSTTSTQQTQQTQPAQQTQPTQSQVQQTQSTSSISSTPTSSLSQLASQLQSQAATQGVENALGKKVPNASLSQLVDWLNNNLWSLYKDINKLIYPYAFGLFLAGLGVLIFPHSRARRIGLWWVIMVVIGYTVVEFSPAIFAIIINKTKSIGG